jgi:YHS domain-containing protein
MFALPVFMFALIERLILFLVIVSVIRSAVQFAHRLWSGFQPRAANSPLGRSARSGNAPIEATTLHQDPVCGTYVGADTSLKRIVGGQVLHFCSPECRDRYAA